MAQKKGGRVVYDVKKVETLKSMIFLLDGYRIHHYEEIGWADRAVDRGDMGWRFRSDWDEIRKMLVDMATVPKSLLHVMKLADVQAALRLVGLIMSTIVILMVGITLFFFWGRQPANVAFITNILSYLSVPVIGLLILSFAGPLLIARKIDGELSEYREAHPEKSTRYVPRIREVVQTLIDSLVDAVKKGKGKPVESPVGPDLIEEASGIYEDIANRILRRRKNKELKHIFNLFNTDYARIRIDKAPTRFRRFYVVEPQL
jgi:hypothetical protein